MPNKQKGGFIDYSADNIYRASKQLNDIAQKQIKLPIIVQPTDPVPQQGVTPVPINPSVAPNSNLVDFMKSLKTLNNEMDEILTELDAQFTDVDYPRVNTFHKAKHNPRYEKFYEGKNRMQGGVIPNISAQEFNDTHTVRQLKALCDEHGISYEAKDKKGEIISKILAHHNIVEEDPYMQEYTADPQINHDVDDGHGEDDVDETDSVSMAKHGEPDEEDEMSEPDEDQGPNEYTNLQDLATTNLKVICNQISNLQVSFNSYISPMFNTLQQGKVDGIRDEIKLLQPKINELLVDEFVHLFHAPQATWIRSNFDKLYGSIMLKINSYVKPLINGGSMNGGSMNGSSYIPHNSINNYMWCK